MLYLKLLRHIAQITEVLILHSFIFFCILGFAVYFVENPDETCLPLNKEFCSKNAIEAKSTDKFTNKCEVVGRFQLKPGNYVVIPSTFKSRVEGEFLLRIFTEKPLLTAKHICRFCTNCL